jgi:hypothetical protein
MTKKAGPFNEFSYNAYFIPRPSPIMPIFIPLLLLLLIFSPAHSPYSSDWHGVVALPTDHNPPPLYVHCTYKGDENCEGGGGWRSNTTSFKCQTTYNLCLFSFSYNAYFHFTPSTIAHNFISCLLIACFLKMHLISDCALSSDAKSFRFRFSFLKKSFFELCKI